ncbi:MAG: hypothetical protein Fur0010_17090 [Bdellovibrio sp.]
MRDWYDLMKAETSFFSYRYFAQKAGINSSGFLKLVIEGQRNLTDLTAEKFIHAIKLWGIEGDYFRTLVRYNQCRSNEEKMIYFKLLENYKAQVSGDSDKFWSDWIEMGLNRMKLNPEEVSEELLLNKMKEAINKVQNTL